MLRSTVGKQTGIKFVPTLTFVADIVPDTARELEEALERARHADAELARAREGAQYAGEPDPYRKPAEDDERRRGRRRDRPPRLPMTVPTIARPEQERARERESTRIRTSPTRARATSVLGGHEVAGAGDPTDGGKHGEIGEAAEHRRRRARRRLDRIPVGGGDVAEEEDAPPVADPGPDA